LVTGSFEDMPALLVGRYGGVADRVVLYFAGSAWSETPDAFARWGDIANQVRLLST
jgi:hypothetical protein